jgi:hypothetical protein
VPILVFILLFIKQVIDKLKAIIIAGAIAIDLFFWYRFYSVAQTLATQYYCTFGTTIWFKMNIICLIIVFIVSILTLLRVFDMDTDIVSKIKSINYKNE